MDDKLQLMADPAVHSLLKLAVNEEQITHQKASEKIGVRLDRLKNITKELKQKKIVGQKRNSSGKVIKIEEKHREVIKSYKKDLEIKHSSEQEKIVEKLKDINYRIIKNNTQNQSSEKDIKQNQKNIFSAIEKIRDNNYILAEKELIKIESGMEETGKIPETDEMRRLKMYYLARQKSNELKLF